MNRVPFVVKPPSTFHAYCLCFGTNKKRPEKEREVNSTPGFIRVCMSKPGRPGTCPSYTQFTHLLFKCSTADACVSARGRVRKRIVDLVRGSGNSAMRTESTTTTLEEVSLRPCELAPLDTDIPQGELKSHQTYEYHMMWYF